MKINDSTKTFLRASVWSWFVFGALSVALELWRPGFVSYLIPVSAIFSVSALAALFSTI
jgi:hypothetical protein